MWFKKHKSADNSEWQSVLEKNAPIFWVMGPPFCGKSTLAEMLAKSSKYYLIRIKTLLLDEVSSNSSQGKVIYDYMSKSQPVPNYIVINLVKETLMKTYTHWPGYIIDGFPINLNQARYFERSIYKVNLIIYVTLILDALLARRLSQAGSFDPNELRIVHVKHKSLLNKIYKKYDQKTINLHSNYPPEDTCTSLIENLEDFWGYRFLRLYNKNQ